jgi:hypothetical protein
MFHVHSLNDVSDVADFEAARDMYPPGFDKAVAVTS